MPRAKLQVARARATKRHCMIILFDAIIASPDLAATPLHAIRGDFSPSFFLFFLFFFLVRRRSWDDRFARNEIIHISTQSDCYAKRKRLADFSIFIFFSFFFFSITFAAKRVY